MQTRQNKQHCQDQAKNTRTQRTPERKESRHTDGDEEDINRRKRLSTAALAKLQNNWIKGDKVKRKTMINCTERL